jgi:hypothetical protein
LDQEVNVIFHSIDCVKEDSISFADAREIGAEPGFEFPWDQLGAVLGAEDEVDRVLGVGVGHVSRLRRSGNLYITDPLLAEWANFCRASGAESGNRAASIFLRALPWRMISSFRELHGVAFAQLVSVLILRCEP